ncbi:DUF1801 domain-containing protein [Cellulophaga sp. F20128]|uniref:YdeI/OmpD-associated family protein n=1 Tax=Cellulophaga sp. F20128 TaxID=2926413 RepID=UPI001FF50FFD|nr:DUF1801 domain-containing protein [Cellulophaga sp. F20128]MCK0157718.1 DUF1801 domain-containing protein [Cellulophaga sp. F20128]
MSAVVKKDDQEKIEAYFAKKQLFKEGIAILRQLALATALIETYKWGVPVYTINNKNVLGILAFKSHFGIWFYNGVFLNDPKKVLQNAQEGKTKAMRHWKFTSAAEIDTKAISAYMLEAIENQKKGIVLVTEKKKITPIPTLLTKEFASDAILKSKFEAFTPYKQKEFMEYILAAKKDATKVVRLKKCIALIQKGTGLHDTYRK